MGRQGAKVVTNSRSPANTQGTAADTAKEITSAGGGAIAVFADVSTMDGGKRLIDECLKAYGTIDILVNNAGYSNRGLIQEITEAAWDEMINVNLKSQFVCNRHAAPVMMAKGSGRIVNVGSLAAINGPPGLLAYSTAKSAIFGFTTVLARELVDHGVTVNCVMPTATTPKVEASRRYRAQLTGQYHAPSTTRLPEHIAPFVAYLATDEAKFINGQVFRVSGGDVTRYTGMPSDKMLTKQGKWSVEELTSAVPNTFGRDLQVAPLTAPPA